MDRSKTKIELFLDAFTDSGVYFASGVPDSLLAELSGALSEKTSFKHFIAANEGVALSLGIGHALATGERPLIYLQNSGLGNLVNPYLSLAHSDVFQIPSIFVIGWRGEYPDLDEPQHRAQGVKTLSLLGLLDLPVLHLNKDSDIYVETLKFISDLNFHDKSIAILVSKDTFNSKDIGMPNLGLVRKVTLETIYNQIPAGAKFFATTGKTARELYEVNLNNNRHSCFYTIGGMGHVSSIALGYKLAHSQSTVVCLDGDGSLLMHLGALSTIGLTQPDNFIHVIFDNKVHESVGGQPIAYQNLEYLSLFKAFNYPNVFEANTKEELENSLKLALQKKTLSAIVVKTMNYSHPNLTRPEGTPISLKKKFMGRNTLK